MALSTAWTILLSLLVIFVTFFVALYLYFTRNFSFWKKLGIPYVKPTPFFGNMAEVFLQKIDAGNFLKNIYDRHKDKPYVGMFSFDRPILIVNDVDLVKNILMKEAQSFINRNIAVDENLDPMFARTIFSMRNQQWRHIRVKLTPTFTSGKMKNMFYLVERCAKELDNYLDHVTAEGAPVEVKDTMGKFTTDSISSCAFGIESNSLRDPDAEIRRHLRSFFEYSLLKGVATVFLFFAPHLQNFFRLKFLDNETTDWLRRTVWDTVAYRQKHGIVRKDFLDNMIEMKNRSSDTDKDDVTTKKDAANGLEVRQYKIEGDDFVAQTFGFFFAGSDTSATTLTYSLYELALHPDLQQRLRTEITEVLNRYNEEVTYDAIQEMTYLDMVVSETLRKYPVLGFLDRVSQRDFQLPGPSGKGSFTLPAGTGVYISLMGIQHNPEYYPEPEKFDPERFTDENKKSRPNYTYFPFGDGPRICIGMRFGLMQVKTGLIHILSRYEVAPCKGTPVPLVFDPRSFLLAVDGGLPLSFRKLVAA